MKASGYLDEEVNYGGEIMTRGQMIQEMRAAGQPQAYIDRYMQGQELAKRIRERAARTI